jgi:hypothetical protein
LASLGRSGDPQTARKAWHADAKARPGAALEQLAQVVAGGLLINAAIYTGYSRGASDWADGIRLEDPDEGRMLFGDDEYPRAWIEAGIRDVAVVGLPYHPDAQRPDFCVGQYVRLVPEPNNPKDRRAIAVRSADARRLAGYVPADRLDEIWSVCPSPQVGIVVWDHYLGPPRERIGLYVLAAPSIELRLVPPQQREAESARRDAIYGAGGEEQLRERQATEAQLEARRQAKANPTRTADEVRAARLAAMAQRHAAGLCVSCGGPVETQPESGERQVRCERCRMDT